MLLSRAEMTHDFGGARFDLARDKELLAWIFNQFLYGEVTGIQVGHWIYNAPNLEAARFLAKQAVEEFQHIDNFLRCLALIGKEPEAPHKIVAFLSTEMMPSSWAEHVSLEMAFGEGLALMCFYGMIDTIGHDDIAAILTRAVKQEESHVSFGEEQTQIAIAGDESLRRRLLGLNLVSLHMVRRLARYMAKTMDQTHPVLSQLGPFLETVVRASELRLLRLGLAKIPVREMSTAAKLACIAEAYLVAGGAKLGRVALNLIPFLGKPRRLTDRYLNDPTFRAHLAKAKAKVEAPGPVS